MRNVCIVSGGITKFSKANPALSQEAMVKDAFEYAMADAGLDLDAIDSSVCSYFSDHFNQQVMFGAIVQDYLGLCPKPSIRVEGGGATGGLGIRAGYMNVASGLSDVCVVYGFEKMSEVSTAKGNEFIALASDTDFDFPVGGFYAGYYATMAQRHMYEFGTTAEQLAMVAVKNHENAFFNPYAQKHEHWTVPRVLTSPIIATPLTRPMVCVMSDGAAVLILASEEKARALAKEPVFISGAGCGTDFMRLGDRPRGDVIPLPGDKEGVYDKLKGRWPGLTSFRGGREAARQAYVQAGISNPLEQIDFAEVHDAFASSEIQTYEELGFCNFGEGGPFVEAGHSFLPNLSYPFKLSSPGTLPVNPSGGLIACGHPIGASGIMQGVFALWQLQGSIAKHMDDDTLQVRQARRGVIHSHAGTGTYVTVHVLERGQ